MLEKTKEYLFLGICNKKKKAMIFSTGKKLQKSMKKCKHLT